MKKSSVMISILIISFLISMSQKSDANVVNLTTEFTKTPIGIDVSRPRFGWQMVAKPGERGIFQTAYQILVKDQDNKVIWDSGKTDSPVSSGIIENFTIDEKKRENYFGFRYSGFIKVPKDGIYTFYLKSNDGSRLFIHGEELIENDANHGAVEEPGSVALKAGYHPIMVKYMQCGGGKSLLVSWSGPGMEKHEITAKELFTDNQ